MAGVSKAYPPSASLLIIHLAFHLTTLRMPMHHEAVPGFLFYFYHQIKLDEIKKYF